MMETPTLTIRQVEGIVIMNSASNAESIESELIDLGGVPFTKLRGFGSEAIQRSMHRVVERTGHLRAPYRSGGTSNGERID